MKNDLTIIFYTANYLDEKNPYFLENVKKQLLKAAGGLPIISVSQKPIDFGQNICVGDIGRSHLNIYRQILIGCKEAKTEFVAMAEDDILYSWEHFHSPQYYPKSEVFLYDMNKLSLFTWTKPPVFSFRHNRVVVNQLIAPRKMLVEALEERFKRYDELKAQGVPEEKIIHYWGDPGRYEKYLGVTERKTDNFMSTCPSIVFTHEYAYGYEFNHGSKKRKGDLRIVEVEKWGRADEILKLYYPSNNEKELWDRLAEKNALYYINSDKGKGITEEEFRKSGGVDYVQYITSDKMIMDRFNLKESSILEIGCGVGRMTEYMSYDFMRVIGIDVSGKMIGKAKARLQKNNIEFIETDGKKIPLVDNCIDLVFSYLVFQHMKNREIVEDNFKEAYRVLKPQGLFKVRIRSDKVDLDHWWGGVEYTEQSIGELIKKVGFKLLKTEPVGNYGFWLWLEK
jgi:SAM-dependent methyltransferase